MSPLKSLGTMMVVLAIALISASSAFAGSWQLTTSNGSYSGSCNDNSNGLNCHGVQVSGEPVSKPVKIESGNCRLMQLPSEKAQLHCKD